MDTQLAPVHVADTFTLFWTGTKQTIAGRTGFVLHSFECFVEIESLQSYYLNDNYGWHPPLCYHLCVCIAAIIWTRTWSGLSLWKMTLIDHDVFWITVQSKLKVISNLTLISSSHTDVPGVSQGLGNILVFFSDNQVIQFMPGKECKWNLIQFYLHSTGLQPLLPEGALYWKVKTIQYLHKQMTPYENALENSGMGKFPFNNKKPLVAGWVEVKLSIL